MRAPMSELILFIWLLLAELPEFGALERQGKRGSYARQATLPTLVWMLPFNRGRARYLRPHIEALSEFLTSLHISHRSFAVSADGAPPPQNFPPPPSPTIIPHPISPPYPPPFSLRLTHFFLGPHFQR